MRKIAVAAIAALALVSALSSCESSNNPTKPTSKTPTTKAPDVSVHESGPESPIAYGLQVPKGATQLGPLVRFRSERLIAAYRPELDAALAQKAAEERERAEEAEKEGKTLSTPAPTPVNRPSDDTFKLLETRPKPDSTVSVMRIDGNPSNVAYRMISQLDALLPKAGINTKSLSKYCPSFEGRYTGCDLDVRGVTGGDREVHVTLTVDPGNIKTRTAPPAATTRPIMILSITYVGEPRKGQLDRGSNDLEDLPPEDLTAPESPIIWPKMDLDAPSTDALLDGKWKVPPGATILLSGYNPDFVALSTVKGRQSDLISEEFTRSAGDKGTFTKDVVEDLNEVSTTYTAERKDGKRIFGTYVLSARGNYAMLFYMPKPKS
ncbi:MAG: hypothetical protein M3Q98_09095 [Actinomycetota bacterium]|nr:hypothetical protein [Actinomycetota bacterium]